MNFYLCAEYELMSRINQFYLIDLIICSLSKKLFGETGGFILEVKREKVSDVKIIFAEHKLECLVIGETNQSSRLVMNGVIDLPVADARSAWENGLRDKLL